MKKGGRQANEVIAPVEMHVGSQTFARLHSDGKGGIRRAQNFAIKSPTRSYGTETKQKPMNYLDLADEEIFNDLPGSPHGSAV